MTDKQLTIDELLSQLIKDAVANTRADDPPRSRKMLLAKAKAQLEQLMASRDRELLEFIADYNLNSRRVSYEQVRGRTIRNMGKCSSPPR